MNKYPSSDPQRDIDLIIKGMILMYNITSDGDTEYLLRGMVSEILERLAQVVQISKPA